jgi:hypothetical protein
MLLLACWTLVTPAEFGWPTRLRGTAGCILVAAFFYAHRRWLIKDLAERDEERDQLAVKHSSRLAAAAEADGGGSLALDQPAGLWRSLVSEAARSGDSIAKGAAVRSVAEVVVEADRALPLLREILPDASLPRRRKQAGGRESIELDCRGCA